VSPPRFVHPEGDDFRLLSGWRVPRAPGERYAHPGFNYLDEPLERDPQPAD
jgi:hypothetical protein